MHRTRVFAPGLAAVHKSCASALFICPCIASIRRGVASASLDHIPDDRLRLISTPGSVGASAEVRAAGPGVDHLSGTEWSTTCGTRGGCPKAAAASVNGCS